MPDLAVTEGHNGGTVSAKVGDVLVVQLSENPTTGFRWVPASVDTNTLALAGDEFQSVASSGVGGGGLRIFRFATRSQGSSTLELKLTRSWESGPPRAIFTVRVNVGS